MSDDNIQEAKRLLPLPRLMAELGYGDRSKKSSRCPFHSPDNHPSFGIFEKDGQWFWKCQAGCGGGDEISFLAKARGIDNKEGTKEFLRMAGVNGESNKPVSAPKASAPKQIEAVRPRPLGELLDGVSGFLRKWVVFQYPEQVSVCALWVLHTWLLKAFDYTPYLWVLAADKRSGKSRLLEVLKLLSCNPELTESGSSAALIRSINEADPPTLLLDEVDCVYSNKKNDVEADSLRRFLNAGYKNGATFIRCVGQGSNQVPTKFPAFCAKALAGIGRDLPDTVQDRTIPIELVRQSREERAERLRDREAQYVTASIRAELTALAQQAHLIEGLKRARPVLPEKLGDRQQDIAEPLVAIADLAGGEWPGVARTALVRICGQEEDASFGVRLLAAVKAAFDDSDKDRLATRQLLDRLVANEDGPWAAMFEDALKHDKLQTAASKLARLLRTYKRLDGERIKPRPIKMDGELVRGFCRIDFEAAWSHWLSPSQTGVTSVTSVTHEGKTVTPGVPVTPLVTPLVTPPVTPGVPVTPENPRSVTSFYEGKSQKVTLVTPVTPIQEGGIDEEAEPGQEDEAWDVGLGLSKERLEALKPEGFQTWNDYEAWFNTTKIVYPGDWLQLDPDETAPHWLAALKEALAKPCEACGESLSNEPYLWAHRLNKAVRCPNCQETHWFADGYEIDEYGLPLCWSHKHTREERLAGREHHYEQVRKRADRWLASDKGRAWVSETNESLAAKESAVIV